MGSNNEIFYEMAKICVKNDSYWNFLMKERKGAKPD
jgi:hypothetical protein